MYGMGWRDDPETVDRHLTAMNNERGDPRFHVRAASLFSQDDNGDILFWELEQKMLGKLLPTWNQLQVGSCFPKGTRVRMEDGTERRIEEVRLLEKVVTAEGNIGTVTRLMVRQEKESLVHLHLWGHRHLKATQEHPILTRRGYVSIGELRAGDWVAMPRYLAASAKMIQTAEHVSHRHTVRAGKRTRRFNSVQGRAVTSVTETALPDAIDLTPGAGRIFGLFLAEGNTDKSKIVWSFNANEEETLIADLVRLLKDEWGVEAHSKRAGNKSWKVTVYGTAWAKLFESLCSTGAGEKKLHSDLASGPRDFMEAMLRGWLDGDGYARRGGERGTSVSHDLALAMFDVAQALGLRPSISVSPPHINSHAAVRRPRWDVGLDSDADNYRVEMDDKHAWRKVRGVVHESFSGAVYNMEVEGDNSYVAEGVGVHNCEGHGNGRAAQDTILVAAASLAPTDDGTPTAWPQIEVSPEITYANGRDMDNYHGGDGGTGAGTAKGLTDVGIGMRAKYATYDFTNGYPENMQAVRSIASKTVPSDIKASCGNHKIKDAALIQNGADAWTAIGFYKPIEISGMISRPMKRQANGMCPATGLNWSHCQCLRGRATLKGGRRVLAYSNSWGDYLGSDNNTVELESGRTIILPPGHYFAELSDVEKDLKRRDSFAFSHAHGWPATRLDWNLIPAA